MDNRMMDITSEGDKSLAMAIELVWPNAPGGLARHYAVRRFKTETTYYDRDGKVTHHHARLVDDPAGVMTLILFWNKDDIAHAQPLPYELKLPEAIAFVTGWLRSAAFGNEPDHDGSNHKGWRLFNEAWGHVAGSHYAICAVQPAWAMYGK